MAARSSPRKVQIDPGALIGDCPLRATSMALPVPVHHRLDVMVEDSRSTKVTRSELISALIASAPHDPVELKRLITDYRESSAGKVIGDRSSDDVIVIPLRGPGRPASPA